MNHPPAKPRKIVSRRVIVFAIVVLSPIILWGLLSIPTQVEYFRIRAEISRIASLTGKITLSIDCRSGLDIGVECDALYDRLTYDEQSTMLSRSGYNIIETTPIDSTSTIYARYPKIHMDVNGSYYEGTTTNLSFQFNDYRP